MTTATESYVYRELDRSKREIRVLEIQGLLAANTSVIQCHLHNIDLDDSPPQFSAISYTWGQPGESGTLEVDGRRLSVSKNAWEVLDAMRSRRGTLFWIDTVCIDQSSIAERNHQVSMMRDIYSSAKRVYAWLGTGTEQSLYAMEVLQNGDFPNSGAGTAELQSFKDVLKHSSENAESYWDVAAAMAAFEDASRHSNYRNPLLSKLLKAVETLYKVFKFRESIFKTNDALTKAYSGCLERFAYLQLGLQQINSNPYWERLWIVQEIVLAKEVLVVMGEQEVSWQHMRQLSVSKNNIEIHFWTLRRRYSRNQTRVSTKYGSSAIPLSSVMECRDRYQEASPGDQKISLKTLLELLQEQESTNGRDMVYGLLGLSEQQITIDYAKDPSRILLDVLHACIISGAFDDNDDIARFSTVVAKSLGIRLGSGLAWRLSKFVSSRPLRLLHLSKFAGFIVLSTRRFF
ncbi:heterokaryon incompatibility protein-domain-containing protein [Cladorrhinum sp. PSN259]|nr:heterokaryon incompatibility protein-domain-containing protein [Cladorrhinum sp. PSN259]